MYGEIVVSTNLLPCTIRAANAARSIADKSFPLMPTLTDGDVPGSVEKLK